MLKSLGFDSFLVKVVKSLFAWESIVSTFINWAKSKEIGLFRSIEKICPLVPLFM
jgi:hypothetical protein